MARGATGNVWGVARVWHWYGLMVGLAVVAGWSLAEKLEPKVSRVWFLVLVLAIVGARIYHIIDFGEYYRENWGELAAVWNGGLGIWGGIAGGAVGWWVGLLGETREIKWSVLGAMVVGLPLAQAIGRLGNGINGEFGERVGAVPWWGAEAILNLLLFGVMWSRRETPPQVRVGMYLAGYGVIRFFLEFWRADSWRYGGLGVAQWMSLGAIVIGYSIWRRWSVRGSRVI